VELTANSVDLVNVVREMAALGLVTGTSGNASLRLDQKSILVTPSAYPYDLLQPQDLVVVNIADNTHQGTRMPSSEVRTHLTIYKARPDVHSILHAHSVFASVCAVAGEEVPPIIDEIVVRVGGGVPLAGYQLPGTWELGKSALSALGSRKAVLLRNHGLLALGKTSRDALEICQLVERAAQIFVFSKLLGQYTNIPTHALSLEMKLFNST